MSKPFLLLTLFTAGTIVGALVTNNGTLDFLAFISGLVFLVKSNDLINSEMEARMAAPPPISEDEDEG